MLTINNNLFPKSSHDALLVLTDLEPDDVLALYILLKKVDKTFPMLVIVGEGNINKTGMVTSLLNLMCFNNFTVVQGSLNLHKDFPEAACRVFGNTSPSPDSNVSIEIEEFLTKYDSPLIFGIKPFTELLDVNPDLLAKCVLALYGGFNLRCMSFSVSKDDIAEFVNTSFKHVILYESFYAAGEQNSVNKTNAADLFNIMLKSKDPVLVGLVKLITIWNDHIADDCLLTTTTVSKQMNETWKDRQWDKLKKDFDQIYNRNLKVISSIIQAENMQMVLADFGLAALLVSNDFIQGDAILCDIGFNQLGYTTFTAKANGGVKLVHGMGFDNIVRIVTNCM